jgi:hypothetical protein
MSLRALLIPALIITIALYLGTLNPGSTFHTAGYFTLLRWALFITAVIAILAANAARLRATMFALVVVQVLFNPFYVIHWRTRQQMRYAQTAGIVLVTLAGARVLFARE